MTDLLTRDEYAAIARDLTPPAAAFIDGRYRAGRGAKLDTVNPATGQVITTIAACNAADVDDAVAKAREVAILRDGQLVQQGTAQQIVLKPADDYISSFVRDVNRGRVIRCKTLMTPGEGVDGPTVDASLVIEEAARIMSAEGKETANVVNSKGKLMGIITMSDIIGAMVPPQEDAISVI